MAVTHEQVVQHTKNWIAQVVIGNNFCPFASLPFNTNAIEYIVEDYAESTLESILIKAFNQLDNHNNIATSFIIFSNEGLDFMQYLDIVEDATAILEDHDYEGVYQIASFHPQYLFGGEPTTSPTHYTNRSPYPMLHIIREDMLEKVIESYPHDMEAIPEANIQFANNKGLRYMHDLWLRSFEG